MDVAKAVRRFDVGVFVRAAAIEDDIQECPLPVLNLWIQEASKAGRFVTKKVGTSVNLADLMTRPLPETEH